ncbi:MAG: TIGR00282 family metallophosphoesterase [Ruminococcaceae bacterium]|nr:TIGR00282 family metallophosphoesterase [Oscillospiraceae bacterium]
MKVFAVGDVVGTSGLEFLRKILPNIKQEYGVDVCIVNGENSADGNGITPVSCEHIFTSGADVITTGNHAYRRKEMYEFFDTNEFVLRPINFPEGTPGRGRVIVDKGICKVAVINLMGTMFMDPLDNPFSVIDKVLESEEIKKCKIKIVDFHAETTSEKRAMGFYLDGRVSVLFGTHTHVQTADEQVLENGTGYITDLGMTGTFNSVLGVNPKIVIDKFKYNMPARFDWIRGESILCGCIFDIDDKTGNCMAVTRIQIKE